MGTVQVWYGYRAGYTGSATFTDISDLENYDFADKSDLRRVYQVTFLRSCIAGSL